MAKRNIRATPEQAKAAGLTPNRGGQYSVTTEQAEIINQIKLESGSKRQKAALKKDYGIPEEHLEVAKNSPHFWKKEKGYSFFVKNPHYQEEGKDEFAQKLIEELKQYSPKFENKKYAKSKDSHLLVIDPADVHIGKLCESFETGEDYNSEIAVKRVLEGVNGILEKASSWSIDKIMLVGGNDILHIDTPKRTTTSGTSQDTCGMWYSNFLKSKQLYVDVIQTLLEVAPVHFVFNPSNHDYTNGFFLADVVKTYFENHNGFTCDTSIAHRKYFTYGLNLIGTTHGDGAKPNDLPMLMAHEAKEWSESKHRYIYTHHLHHKVSKDYMSVCVETLRSPSGTDSWHHRNGYQFAPKAIEGFLHHKEHGQVCRFSHLF